MCIYKRPLPLQSADGGEDLSSRLLQQGAQYFSATEGDSDNDDGDRVTLQADQYVTDPDQPKLALAEDSIQPAPANEKQPPPLGDEYRGRNRSKLFQVLWW